MRTSDPKQRPPGETIVEYKGDISVQTNTDSISATIENDIYETVVSSLGQTGYAPHRALRIRTDKGVVFVEGILPSWFMRQVALECIKRVAGVSGVIDRIQVRTDPQAFRNMIDAKKLTQTPVDDS